jgi:hypothetical protein
MSKIIKLPNDWIPREDQMPLWSYLSNGGKRAFVYAHRRWGKDDVALHRTACAAMQRVGTYWHCLPAYSQCRKAVWDAVNPRTGKRRVDEAFPDEICEVKRSQDMFIRFINGSSWQLVGSDNYNSLVGSPPVGLVFSEYALADPGAWGYLRPILAENGGWAIFITTTRGRNHAYKLYNMAKDDPDWFSSLITIEDSGLLTPEEIERERQEYIATFGPDEGEALFLQEWYCAFDGAVSGSYYGSLMSQAEKDNRITRVPYDPALKVTTSWDLGVGDATGIWFWQVVGNEVRAIEYIEASGEGMPYYAKLLKERPYVYDQHIMPHDVKVRELGTGKSRYEMAQALGINPITIAKKLPVDDGINATRALLPRVWFDSKKCAQGIEHLKAYKKEYDDVRKEFKNKPYHDSSSHGADSMRYFAVGYSHPTKHKTVEQIMGSVQGRYTGVW